MEKVGKMEDEEFKTWCADGQQEFCDTLKEVTASFIADFEGNHGGEDDNGDNDPTAYLAQKRSKKEGNDQRKAAASKIEWTLAEAIPTHSLITESVRHVKFAWHYSTLDLCLRNIYTNLLSLFLSKTRLLSNQAEVNLFRLSVFCMSLALFCD